MAHSGKDVQPTSGAFIKKYHLTSASAVQRSLTALQDKDIISNINGKYFIYDYFLYYWLNKKYTDINKTDKTIYPLYNFRNNLCIIGLIIDG